MGTGQTGSGSWASSFGAGGHWFFSATPCPGSGGGSFIPEDRSGASTERSEMSGGAPQTTKSDAVAKRGAPLAISENPLFISETPPAVSQTPLLISQTPLAVSETPLFISRTPLGASETPLGASFSPLFKWGGPFAAKNRLFGPKTSVFGSVARFSRFCLRTLKNK